MYDWSKGVTFMQAKIHARNGYRWTRPCHEIITRYGEGPDVYATTEKFLMHHHPDDTKGRAYYLPLLRMGYKEMPKDDRSVFYYGRELYLRSNYSGITEEFKNACRRESTRVLREALELIKDHPNRAESCYALRMIGQMNDDEEAFKQAIKECPDHREGYIWYADWLYYKKRFERATKMAETALTITNRTADYTVEGRCWDGYPKHLLSWCYYHQGDLDIAIEDQEEAIKMEPNNEFY
jgi:tetratricopeptide (TPR) repeat protein